MEKEKEKTYINVALEGAATEVVQRYGSAVKENLVAYIGIDNETGERLKKGLKDIAKEKVNPDYKDINLKQQAGFSAENKYTARQNAERIINRDKSRVHNTDVKGSGSYNELFDHIITDENGIVISQEQMKFVGSDPKACLNKLAGKKFQKYFDADAKITVPSDYYEGILEEAQKTIDSLEKQLKHAKESGNTELEKNLEERIAKYKKIKASIKDSGVSNKEAMEARLHPKISTAKDVVKVAHRAGVEQAAYGAVIGGSVSIVKNIVSVVKGQKEPEEAAIEFAKDTSVAAVSSYATAFAGSVIRGGMQNSASKTVKSLAKTNLAATIVTSTVEAGKSLKKYISGEIEGIECLEELGEKGTGQLSAAMFAVVGQAVIPIPVVGAMIGSMVGYALSSACYGELVDALKEAKLAHEERIRIERECEESIKMIVQFREEMNDAIEKYLNDMKETFNNALENAERAIWKDDIDGFIGAANSISNKLGKKALFNTFREFDDFMNTSDSFKF